MFPIFVRGCIFTCLSFLSKVQVQWVKLTPMLLITENHFRSRTKVKTKKSQFRGLPLPPRWVGTPLRVLTMLIYCLSGGSGVLGSKMPNDLLEVIRGQMRSNASKRLNSDGRSFSIIFIHIGPSLPIFSKILGQLTLFLKTAIFTP